MKKILVIEDTESIRDNIAEMLELSNYSVITAPNGKEGVEKAIANHPDLIICDIMMPELDGYGVLHMVQKHPDLRFTPFIFLTAKAEAIDVRKGMGQGADDYIVKPFELNDLLNTVETRLKKAEALKEQFKEATPELASTEQALKNFIEGRQSYTYKKKQLIFSEGNHPTRVYYIQKGKVKIFKTNDEGKELIVSLGKAGDFLGYAAVWEGSAYKVSAEAMEDCTLAVISRHEFEELLQTHPGVMNHFMQLLAKELTGKDEQLVKIAYNSLRRKVADALLFMLNKYRTSSDQPFVINISRENLASLAGTATESLIRTLSDFKNEHLIDIQEGKVLILNEKKIAEMVN